MSPFRPHYSTLFCLPFLISWWCQFGSTYKIDEEHLQFLKLMQHSATFGTPTRLIDLAEAEHKIFEILRNWKSRTQFEVVENQNEINHEDDQFFYPIVDNHLKNYDQIIQAMHQDGVLEWSDKLAVEISENPIMSFLMLRRLRQLIDEINEPDFYDEGEEEETFQFGCDEYWTCLQNDCKMMTRIREGHVIDSAARILRIQHVYNLGVNDIVKGKLQNIQTNVKLPIDAWYDLGLVALQNEQYTLAFQWFQFTQEYLEKEQPPDQIEDFIQNVKQKKMETIEKHDETWTGTNLTDFDSGQFHFDSKFVSSTSLKKGWPVPRRVSWIENKKWRLLPQKRYEWGNVIQYWSLCSGDNGAKIEKKGASAGGSLFCWSESKIHPFYRVAPLKIEFLSRRPHSDIIQIYDLFSDNLIKKLERLSINQLAWSPPHSLDPKTAIERRCSMDISIPEEMDEDVTMTTETILRVTGLKLPLNSFGQPFQLLMYTPGGHFQFHPDRFEKEPLNEPIASPDARIATVNCYFSTVTAGGWTVFYGAGAMAKPIKGSAIFWFNTHSDMTLDEDNVHAGCPVILGHKFAGSKFISSYEQMATHPCSLNKGDRFRIAMNGKFS